MQLFDIVIICHGDDFETGARGTRVIEAER